jgi:hypothetical protein
MPVPYRFSNLAQRCASGEWPPDWVTSGMANGAPAWMAAVPCRRSEALHDAAPRDSRLNELAPCHRRELASLTALAVASSVSLLVLASGVIAPTVITAVPLAIQFSNTAHAPASLHVRVRVIRAGVRHEPPQTPVVRGRMVRADLKITFARKGSGALKRVLFGSGEYRVQPFPVAAE